MSNTMFDFKNTYKIIKISKEFANYFFATIPNLLEKYCTQTFPPNNLNMKATIS